MQTLNIHEAKTHLSRVVEQVRHGDTVVIARSGKPLVKVTPLDAPSASGMRRRGFMEGQIAVPADFDSMGGDDIEQAFLGAP